jgi:N-acetylgalactosamine-6-sulfatase
MTLRLLLASVFLGFGPLTTPLLLAEPPNIIFIVADDMGYADISSFGAPDIKTPNIDRIGEEGIKFTNIYAMGPECTPSRVSFLTGRYPQRVGGMECAIGTGNVGRYNDAIQLAQAGDLGLPPSHSVLAPKLKDAGYHNVIFGKWHLGYEDKFSPLDQGFDKFIGFLGGNVDYFRHEELSDIDVYLSDREILNNRKGYTTNLITQDAIKFLKESRKDPDTPFFLYLPHAAPHFPFQGPEDDDGTMPSAEDWTKGTRETYLKMMEALDQSVGEVLEKIEAIGIAHNTIIVFTSDHGAMKPGLNNPWRDYKGTLFEGGIRVPLLVRWPAKIAPGSTSDQVGSLMDLTKSFLEAAGAETNELNLDGEDLFTLALEGEPTNDRTLHWRAKRSPRIWNATRHGEWKWIRKDDDGHVSEWLFNLNKDPYEKDNLLERQMTPRQSATHAMLKRTHEAWEASVAPSR